MSALHLSVLGGTGFVGTALLRHLGSWPDGTVRVRALARNPDAVAGRGRPWLEVVPGDLSALPARLFWPVPHVVVHFATKQREDGEPGFEETNVAGTRRLCDALPPTTRGVLYGSSLSVYGQGPQRGEDEERALAPETPLALTRAAAEQLILERMARTQGSALCLRPRFILGRHDPYTLPGLLRLTRRGVTLSSGQQRFSVIDVDDYARLIATLARDLLERRVPLRRPVHVGYRRPLTLAELQGALADAFDLPRPRRHLRIPCPLLALGKQLLGLASSVTKFELMGRDHWVDVSALEALAGSAIVSRDPRDALAEAIEWLRGEGRH